MAQDSARAPRGPVGRELVEAMAGAAPAPPRRASPAGIAGRSARRDDRGKITVLQFAYGTSLYGAERWVLTLIKHLDRSRFDVVVGAIRDADSPDRPLIDEAARLGFETLVLDARARRLPSAVGALRGAIRARGIDVVHSHGSRQDVVALLATRLLDCPVRTLATPHGWQARDSLKTRFYEAVDRAVLPFFDAVAPLSRGLADSLRHVPIRPGRLRLIPNGVDLGEVAGAPAPAGLLPGQASSDDFVIGYVGQLIPRKGVDVLLAALSRLDRRGWCCIILGDGPARAALEREAGARGLDDRVRFLGFRPDRLSFLKRFDLFVLPSYREGIPRAMLEALAAGVPCVGSGIPGILELLEDGLTGTTVPPGDPERLADAIRRSMVARQEAARLTEAGKARVEERFSANRMARTYEALYRQLCRAR